MPFTFSHPAAILPLSYLPKKYISFTGLVAGSMIPDLEYFFRFRAQSYYSHTWSGIFWFDLPFAIMACFLFHNVIRDLLIQNLPGPVSARCRHCFHFDWNKCFQQKWIIVIACILIGTVSHLIWDQMIHETIASLEQTSYIQRKDIPLKDVIVYYSYWSLNSGIGIILLLISFWKMPVRQKKDIFFSRRTYWPLIFFIGAAVFVLRLQTGYYLVFADLVDSAIASLLIGLLLTSMIFKSAYKI
jgi:hypothetical protein